MYAMQLPSATLVGASPEVLVRVDRDRTVTLRPIAGTRRRAPVDAEDRALEAELLADPKERAEHLMNARSTSCSSISGATTSVASRRRAA
jgi:anthranilate synthase component I